MTSDRRRNWKEVDRAVLESALSTGDAHPRAREAWPPWAREAKTVTGVWLFTERPEGVASTQTLSTGHIHGRLLVERNHKGGRPFRYDQYFLVQVVGGRVFQLGPDKDIEFGHHQDGRPDWLNEFRSESTG